MERIRHFDLRGQQLEALWKPLAIVQLVSCAFGWFPLVGWICALASFVMGICYLVAFHKTKDLYLERTGIK